MRKENENVVSCFAMSCLQKKTKGNTKKKKRKQKRSKNTGIERKNARKKEATIHRRRGSFHFSLCLVCLLVGDFLVLWHVAIIIGAAGLGHWSVLIK